MPEVDMIEVIQDLRTNKMAIEEEFRRGSDSILDSIATKYGYNPLGLHTEGILGIPNLHLVIFGRETRYTHNSIDQAIEKSRSQGYQVNPGYVIIRGGAYANCSIISKHHEERGRVSLVERNPNLVEPIAIVGQYNKQTIIGLPIGIGPEHVGMMQDLTRGIGMVPIKSDIPPKSKPPAEGFDIRRLVEGIDALDSL